MIEQTREKLTPYNYTSGVPAIRKPEKTKEKKERSAMSMLMMACCIPMVIGAALIFYSMPADLGIGARMYALAPFAGCVAMHFVMHRFMGKSCHPKSERKDAE